MDRTQNTDAASYLYCGYRHKQVPLPIFFLKVQPGLGFFELKDSVLVGAHVAVKKKEHVKHNRRERPLVLFL
jgi:hypothetical protein